MKKLSNFYIPSISNRLLDKLDWDGETNENEPNNPIIWVGIADAAVQNTVYKKLLSEIEIANVEIS